ncbi:MAG: DUF2065 domain-containing protein [Arenicellales bacterium]|nr:DUF2065 domain-containing protein [Gammaproteobacteria bacterium]NDG44326.1 DUF2065 domain-containing protein [Gammaproteobacteria bacterium]
MDWQDLFAALALVLIIEGIIPFVSPARYRRLADALKVLGDRQLRIAGLATVVIGLALLTIVRA